MEPAKTSIERAEDGDDYRERIAIQLKQRHDEAFGCLKPVDLQKEGTATSETGTMVSHFKHTA